MRVVIHFLSFVVLALTITASSVGLFWGNEDKTTVTVTSRYGNEIELYGSGIYKNDTSFLTPIFQGTDFVMLFVVAPLLLYFIYLDKKYNSLKSLLRLTSLLFVVFYYAFNLVFGVVFNYLHLVYTFFVSASFFALVLAIKTLDNCYFVNFSTKFKTTSGLKIFITISGISLFIAWLPDIINAHISNKPLSYLENYTTSVTYILDMGFISPLLFLSLYLLTKHIFYGICLLSMLLHLSMLIGVILPAQTWFQIQSGIEIPLPELITKVFIFIILSFFAFYFNRKIVKAIQ